MERHVIKRLALETGKKPQDMLVLTQVNDPFYIGTVSQYIAALWAKELYMLHGRRQKVHIRRLHYFALTQPQHKKPGGQVYRNISSDWKFLCDACKFARYLEILPYDAFVDRRSVPKLPAQREAVGFDSPQEWSNLLSLKLESLCRAQMKLMLSKLMPAHIEVWVEKSTAADLIEPVGDSYGINVVTTLGQLSLTAVWDFVKRISRSRKPVRIFYISDFDPAGESMPISVARKIEFLMRRYGLSGKVDLKLRPLALTRQQCRQFKLPGTPLPENKKRKFKFTRYNGHVTTELHALEVARPGHIRQIVENELKRYVDIAKVSCASQLARAAIKQALKPIRAMLAADCQLALAIRLLEKVLLESWTGTEYDGPWLFDSERDYLTQLAEYHLQKLR